MQSNPLIRNATNPLHFIVLIIIVAVLYFTRDICIPFVLAILLTFVLSPIVRRVQKRTHLPRVAAVFCVVGVLLIVLGLGGWLVGGQLVSLAEKLPQYQANVHEKFQSFHSSPGGVLDRLNRTLDSYSKELEGIGTNSTTQEAAATTQTMPDTTTASDTQPIPVAIVRTQPSKLAAIETLALRVLNPLATVGIVLILGLFMLIRHEDVRDRAIRLLGGGQWQVATQALDDAGDRVSRYLWVQLNVNISFGVCIGLGLLIIGVPYSLLWGLLAASLRFIPYFGGPIAAVLPLLMAFAAMPGWTAVILTLILFAGLELTIANFIEPWLYGSSTRISPLAIIASAFFWSWLWGPIGLLLSTPLTVCLVVLGQHVPRLWFLNVLLGDEPVLTPDVRFYQRLLAADQAEAWEIADQKLRESSLVELYDDMMIPGIILAEEDRHRDALDETREKYIFQSVRDLLNDLAERPIAAPVPATVPEGTEIAGERATIGAEPDDVAPLATIGKKRIGGKFPKVLCIPANDEADEMAGIMLSHLLKQRGITAEVISFKSLAGERLDLVKESESWLVCVSSVPPQALRHARYLCKRLRSRYPELKVIAGLWHAEPNAGSAADQLPADVADEVVTTLASAVDRIAALANLEMYRTADRPEPVAAH